MKYITVLLLITWTTSATAQTDQRVEQFLSGLDSIRIELKIPGMAAAVSRRTISFEG